MLRWFLPADLSQYVIVQEITKLPAGSPSLSPSLSSEKPIPVMRIHYHFNTAPSVPPLSPFALHDDDLEVRPFFLIWLGCRDPPPSLFPHPLSLVSPYPEPAPRSIPPFLPSPTPVSILLRLFARERR